MDPTEVLISYKLLITVLVFSGIIIAVENIRNKKK